MPLPKHTFMDIFKTYGLVKRQITFEEFKQALLDIFRLAAQNEAAEI